MTIITTTTTFNVKNMEELYMALPGVVQGENIPSPLDTRDQHRESEELLYVGEVVPTEEGFYSSVELAPWRLVQKEARSNPSLAIFSSWEEAARWANHRLFLLSCRYLREEATKKEEAEIIMPPTMGMWTSEFSDSEVLLPA